MSGLRENRSPLKIITDREYFPPRVVPVLAFLFRLNNFCREYLLTDNEHREFIALAGKSPRMRKVHGDQHPSVYRVLKNQLFIDLSKP